MGVLYDYVRYLPTLKHSPKAVPTTRNGNIPFGEADLAAIMLVSVLMTWQNQYNLNHTMVPESTHALLPDLEAIEHIMVENHNEKLKAYSPAPRVIRDARRLGAQQVESLRRVAVRSVASVAKPTAVPIIPTTP
jgi:hypothetical protein